MQNNKELCLALLACESEDEVVKTLSNAGYWNDNAAWQLLGDMENNYSIVGNQKESPVDALVEKIVNSVDAVLMRECLSRSIEPESSDAPQSISEALEKYFDIKNGNLANITAGERTRLAENIGLIASGTKGKPTYTIFDRGEGQTPSKISKTFLSLAKSNKLRIPFVQGQFNQGGTAVLRFCGSKSLQLLISRRNPKIPGATEEAQNWGFTVVRREDPSDGKKSSSFTYLSPGNSILSFQADQIDIAKSRPGSQDIAPLKGGTIIKLFDYEMPGGLKTVISFDLYNQISLLLPGIGLPVRFYERRAYKGHSLESTLAGLKVRLEDDKRENIEEGFPSYQEITAGGEKFFAWIYAFKKKGAEKYRKSEGVVFSFHGQTQGTLSSSFFTRGNIGMSYIADSILVIVECDKLTKRATEVLFMNSRDRLSRGELRSELESELSQIIREHKGLIELRQRRRRETIDSKLEASKPLQDMIDEAIKKSPALQHLFKQGFDIKNPFKPKAATDSEEQFNPQEYPSKFTILEKDISKDCHINLRFRCQFETDVVNDYFGRERYPGHSKLELNGVEISPELFVLNLWNGTATLTVSLPPERNIGDVLEYKLSVWDETLLRPFENSFQRTIVGPAEVGPGGKGSRKKPPTQGEGSRNIPDALSMPLVTEVYENEWQEHEFSKYSGARAIDNGEGGFDFFVNMDNVFLLTELKRTAENDAINLIKAQFKFGLVLIALSLISHKKQSEGRDGNGLQNLSIEEYVKETTTGISPVLLPVIEVLGELELEEVYQDVILVPETEE